MSTRPADIFQEPKKKKSRVTITSSGRTSKIPKHLLTTSEDEAPLRKNNKASTTIAKEKERLQNILKKLNQAKQKIKENVNPKSINNKTINDYIPTSREMSSKRIESSFDTIPQNHLENPLSKSDFADPTQGIESSPVRTKNTVEKVRSSVSYPIDENSGDSNNYSVQILNTPEVPVSHNKETTRSNIVECGKPVNEELDTSILITNDLVKIPETLFKLGNLIEDLSKQYKKIEQQNRDIMKQNEDIQEQNNDIKQLLSQGMSQINSGEEKLSDNLFEPLEGFPLHTVEEFDRVNATLKLRKNLYNYLKNRGGTKLREFLSVALKLTMTDKLVSQFTWLGDENRPKFGNTKVSNVLYVAAKNCVYFAGPRDKNEFKTEMLEVLRSTKQRFRNSNKKSMEQGKEASNNDKFDGEKNVGNSAVELHDANHLSAEEIAKQLKQLLEDLEDPEVKDNSDAYSTGESEFGDDEED